jgi:hypothetical protein
MKRVCSALAMVLLAAAVGVCIEAVMPRGRSLAWAGDEPKSAPAKLPALKVDRSAPLLLLEEPKKKTGDEPEVLTANNESCYVCHGDYREEPMVIEHAKVNVGCVKCHGSSYAHRDDEDNITPPDVMFAPEKIEPGCKTCHDTHDASAVKVITRWQERCAQKTNPKDLLCTDCHGAHRRPFRTVRWDKHTGKLLTNKAPAEAKPAKDAANSK